MKNWTQSEKDRQAQVESGETVLANLKTDKHLIAWAKANGLYVFIGRPGDWRNPYVIGEDGDRETVLESFEIYFARKYGLHERLPELKGKVLGCYCYPERCHGDQLIAAAKAHSGKCEGTAAVVV